MKLTQELNDALNNQIQHELRNQNIYLQIASYFELLQLKHLSKYFMNQAKHEKEHADLFINHINDRTGGIVEILEIDAPMKNIQSIEDVAKIYVEVEESTTESIEEIYSLAFEQRSYMDLPFLSTMLNEQVEEEDSANELAMKLKMCKDIVLFDATLQV